MSFDIDALKENLNALFSAVIRAKPATAKGQYIQKVTLSTTMGPGVKVDKLTVAS